MKVLFAVNNDKIAESIIRKYQEEYREIISSKTVYYFNAIIKELQKDKSYDRIVISEDLEMFANDNYQAIDKFVFEKMDAISDEATNNEGNDIPIILLCTDRRTKNDPILVKLFGLGIYGVLIGQDRSIPKVCNLIYKPRSKKEAKQYYKVESENVNYSAEQSSTFVSETEIQNIVYHYKKIGNNVPKCVQSFDSIYNQYSEEQIKIIIQVLPASSKIILEQNSDKYREIMGIKGKVTKTPDNIQQKEYVETKIDSGNKLSQPVIIPTSVNVQNVNKVQKSAQEIREKQELLRAETQRQEEARRARAMAKKKEEEKIAKEKAKAEALAKKKEEEKIAKEKAKAEALAKKKEEEKIAKEKAKAEATAKKKEEEKLTKEKAKTNTANKKKVTPSKTENVGEVKRGRGRPRKVTTEAATTVAATATVATAQKKRGRPRKNPAIEIEEKIEEKITQTPKTIKQKTQDEKEKMAAKLEKEKEEKNKIIENLNNFDDFDDFDEFEDDYENEVNVDLLDDKLDNNIELYDEDDDLDLLDFDDEEEIPENNEELIDDDDFEDDDDLDLFDFDDEDEEETSVINEESAEDDNFEDDDDLDLFDDDEDEEETAEINEESAEYDDFEDDDELDLFDDEEDEEETPEINEESAEYDDFEDDDDLDLFDDEDEEEISESNINQLEDESLDAKDDLDLFIEDEEEDDVLESNQESSDIEDMLDLFNDDESNENNNSVIEEDDDFESLISDDDKDADDEDLPAFEDDEIEDINAHIIPQVHNGNFDGINNKNYKYDSDLANSIKDLQEVPEEGKVSYNADIDNLITSGQKVVAFVGTPKNGTSFIVNNVADIFANRGIKTAILDLTKNKNAFYTYTNNEEALRTKAYECLEKLRSGTADGIKVNENLSVYTCLPGEDDSLDDVTAIIQTLIDNYPIVLLDCDFNTSEKYFRVAQEIYLVQSLDVLTIQPLTAFLREQKVKGILNSKKLRIIINKDIKVSTITEKLLIEGMSSYNDPGMTYMTKLFDQNTIKYTTIPFDSQVYIKYLEGLVNCKISTKKYPKNFLVSLNNLCDMIYPNVSATNEKKYNVYEKKSKKFENVFSKKTNSTLDKMKKNIK